MFTHSKYTKIYFQIVERAKNRMIEGYKERHHIIPKCLGGADSDDNLVNLTAREHFVCHLLLTKMSSNRQLKFALFMMTVKNPYHGLRYTPNSRIYEICKKENSKASTERMVGKKSCNKGKSVYHDPITFEEVMSFDTVPGWIPGWSPARKEKLVGKNAKRIYFYDPLSLKTVAIKDGDIPPEGYLRGNPKANTSERANLRGTKYYHDPQTGEEKRCQNDIPEGWLPGRSMGYITNGIENLFVKLCDPIPVGFRKGRTMDWKRNERKYTKS